MLLTTTTVLHVQCYSPPRLSCTCSVTHHHDCPARAVLLTTTTVLHVQCYSPPRLSCTCSVIHRHGSCGGSSGIWTMAFATSSRLLLLSGKLIVTSVDWVLSILGSTQRGLFSGEWSQPRVRAEWNSRSWQIKQETRKGEGTIDYVSPDRRFFFFFLTGG